MDKMIVEAANFNKKIRLLTDDELLEKLKNELAVMFVTLGFEAQPTEIEIVVVSKSLRKFHEMLTIEEILCALELNANSKLTKKIQHFQLFSVDYVTEIIDIYLDQKYKAQTLFLQKFAESKKLDEPKRATPEQSYNFIKKFVEENNALPITADWSSCFDWMWAQKMTGTKEYLINFFDKHSEIYVQKIKAQIATSTNFVEKQTLEIQIQEAAVKSQVRKVWVQLYFENTFKT